MNARGVLVTVEGAARGQREAEPGLSQEHSVRYIISWTRAERGGVISVWFIPRAKPLFIRLEQGQALRMVQKKMSHF